MKKVIYTSILCLLSVAGCKEKQVAADSTGAGAAVVADDGSVILALKDDPMPIGAVLESNFSMEMVDGKMTITLNGRVTEVPTTSSEKRKERIEGLGQLKVRRTLIMQEKILRTTMSGKVQSPHSSSDPMVGIPVIIEKAADGTWTASLESGDVTPEIAKELEKLSKRMGSDSDQRIYGTEPRRVGDEWVATGADLIDIYDSTGTFNMKLEAIEDYKGERCAKITGTMVLEGTEPEGGELADMKMRMSGAFTIYRSLEHRVDMSNEMTGKIEVSGDIEPQPGMKMKTQMEGATKMTGSAVITMPK